MTLLWSAYLRVMQTSQKAHAMSGKQEMFIIICLWGR